MAGDQEPFERTYRTALNEASAILTSIYEEFEEYGWDSDSSYTAQPLRGSRSFGAKNNDPLEVIVFTGLFERLFWLGWGVCDKPQR
jgi:hypothetical protein